MRSGPTSFGLSISTGMPVCTPGPITSGTQPSRSSESCAQARPSAGTVDDTATASMRERVEVAQVEQALQRRGEVVGRQVPLRRDAPALDEGRRRRTGRAPSGCCPRRPRAAQWRAGGYSDLRRYDEVGRERRLGAVLGLELLDRDVLRRVDVGLRDDPRRTVLVPHPDVLHREMDQRVRRLVIDLQVELVAEVRRLLREHAVPEEPEDGRVLALETQLELGVELLEIVDVGHQQLRHKGSARRTGLALMVAVPAT